MTLDTFQQVATLALVANQINNYNGTVLALQRIFQVGLTSSVFPYVGNEWKTVWGPAVWKKTDVSSTGPDNSWYVAFHPSLKFEDGSVHPTYVIAIAGTPATSSYVWINETLAAQAVSDFKAWVGGGIQTSPKAELPLKVTTTPGVPYVSTGTLTAVQTILTTPAPAGAASAGVSLLEFMKNLNHSTSPSSRVISTGHSLGGALSPTLALALVSAGVIPADITLTYPIAGPSPGNSAYADLFTQTFPSRKSTGAGSYKGWNLNLVNKLDAVPQFWSLPIICREQNLTNIPTLYGFPPLPVVSLVATAASVGASASGTVYKPLPSQYFTGPPPASPPILLLNFITTAYTEHMDSYPSEVGITLPSLDKAPTAQADVTEKSETDKLFSYPGIANFAWANQHPDQTQKGKGQVNAAQKVQGVAARL